MRRREFLKSALALAIAPAWTDIPDNSVCEWIGGYSQDFSDRRNWLDGRMPTHDTHTIHFPEPEVGSLLYS